MEIINNNELSQNVSKRALLKAVASLPLLALAGVLRAQIRPPVIVGWLSASSREGDEARLGAFHEGMSALGWKVGTQFVIEGRWLGGQMGSLQAQAADLAARKPQVIVASASTTALAAAKAAPTTPIVLASGNPVESGLAKSLSHPGGLITGMSNFQIDLMSKQVELLLEAAPKFRRIGFLVDPNTRSIKSIRDVIRRTAQQYAIDARVGEATTPEELENAISNLIKDGAQAIVIAPAIWFGIMRQQIIRITSPRRMPVVGSSTELADIGGLMAYRGDLRASYARLAYFVDRILKGTKPGNLPIEQPTRFELVVNLKTAKALGITIPPTVMVRATRVIE